MYTPSSQEKEITHMKQDVSGSLNELQKAANFVLELIYELKANVLRLHILETELEDKRLGL